MYVNLINVKGMLYACRKGFAFFVVTYDLLVWDNVKL